MKLLAVLLLWAAPALGQDGAALFRGAEGLQPRLGSAEGPVLPQGQFSCAGCHGADGRGGVEGGAQPAPPISLSSLAAPTPRPPAYDQAGFARLLAQGVTPSGRVISARMPRFQGSPETVAALWDYLGTLDADEQQGLGADSIAVALPDDPRHRAAARAAIAAFNAQGGAFGRQVIVAEPAFLDLGSIIADLLPRLIRAEQARLQDLLQTGQGLTPFTDGTRDARIAGTMDELGPRLPGILPTAVEVQIVGPPAEALAWAIAEGQDGKAAHAYAAALAALIQLRDQGRQPTRTRLAKSLESLDLSALVEIYRYPEDRTEP